MFPLTFIFKCRTTAHMAHRKVRMAKTKRMYSGDVGAFLNKNIIDIKIKNINLLAMTKCVQITYIAFFHSKN